MIFPRPKLSEANRTFGFTHNAVSVSGDCSASAERILSDLGVSVRSDGFVLKLVRENTRELTYIEETHTLSGEKYIAEFSPEGGIIRFSAEAGLFRALCRFADEISDGKLPEGRITDYPLFARRGYIEGFYGTPWNDGERRNMLVDMARRGMNTYYYAPKDDPYHRENWRCLYPEKELGEIRALADLCAENYVEMNYCLAPGLSIRYSSDEDFAALTAKLKQLYSAGVRGFGLLLDDIPEKLFYPEDVALYDGETVNAHIDLANRLFAYLKELDSSVSLTICPMQYHGKGDEYFISKLGSGISPEVRLFWTGRNICSQELTADEAAVFIRSTGHRPLYWDNFPVNDAEMYNEMHLGYYSGREPSLAAMSEGIIVNVMEYCECSRVPLYTTARFLWSPYDYDGYREYTRAIGEVCGEDAELFMYFADNLLTSCLKVENSPILNGVCASAESFFGAGDTANAFRVLNEYSEKLSACCDMLESGSSKLYSELEGWAKKQRLASDLLCAALKRACTGEGSREELSAKLKEYLRTPETLCDFSFTLLIERLISL